MAIRNGNIFIDDEELECVTVRGIEKAKKSFDEMLSHYLEPIQKAIFDAGMIRDERYTLFCLSDFGFPVTIKFTFYGYEFTTYAQYSDVVKLIFRPFRKRSLYGMQLYNRSFAIFKGWQDLRKEDTTITISEDDNSKIVKSKYGSFDSRYIEEGLRLLENPVVIYKNYKTDVNGKIYA